MEVFQDLDLIKLLLTFGFIFLMWMKSFWDELQEYKAVFYPDGLDTCPPETYTIDDDSGTVRCRSCPTCPPGEEPSPPCGSTLAIIASDECVPCKTGTFSDEADRVACKVCTDCAARKVVSSCTADRNTECKGCPWRYFEDHTTHICRHCSFCCEKNSAAQMECLMSKTCKGNCSQSARIKGRYFSTIFNRLIANVMNSTYNTTSVSNFSRLPNVRQGMSKRLETQKNNNPEGPSRSERVTRDIHLGVTNQENYKDTSNGKTKNAMTDSPMKDIGRNKIMETTMNLLQIPDISSNGLGQINLPMKKGPRISDINRGVKEIQLVSTKLQSHVPPLTAPDTNLGQFMLPTPESPTGPKIFNGNGAMKKDLVVSTTLQPSVPPPTAQDFGQYMPLTLENQETPKIFNGNGAVKEEQLFFKKLQLRVHQPTARDSNIGQFMPFKPEHPITSKVLNGNGAVKKAELFSSTLQPSVPPLQAPESNIGQLMLPAPIPVKTAKTSKVVTEPRVINTDLFLSSFSGTIAALLLLCFIAVIIYIVYRSCVQKLERGYRKISGSDKPGEEQIEDDQLDENSNEDEMRSLLNQTTTEICDTTQIEEDLNLSEIPQDLEDLLVTILDVTHGRSGRKEYGWEKVGSAAGISRHELKLYRNEYLRQNGSPTKLLLEKLGSQGKTISHLLDILQTPRVQLDSVAVLIRHCVTRE